MNENWLPVPGFEGYYEVSDIGRVRSLDRWLVTKRGMRAQQGRVLAPWSNEHGYQSVTLHGDFGSIPWKAKVQALVLLAFIGPRPAGMEACHNDGNLLNNRRNNLRWDTHAANMRDQLIHGTHYHAAQTHCSNGHEFTVENTRLPKHGRRYQRFCRTCARDRSRRVRLLRAAVSP